MKSKIVETYKWIHLLLISARYAVYGMLLFFLAPMAQAQELTKLPLDNANTIGTVISTDQDIKWEGTAAIRISTLWPTTICLGKIDELNIDTVRLIYQAKVKCENLVGRAFLEMWCQVGSGQYFSRGMNSAVTGTTNWQTLQTPFTLQAGQKARKATLNLVINGQGTVWIDDVRLLKEPLK